MQGLPYFDVICDLLLNRRTMSILFAVGWRDKEGGTCSSSESTAIKGAIAVVFSSFIEAVRGSPDKLPRRVKVCLIVG